MKAEFPRSFVLLAGVLLVVALAAVALLVGARAVAGAGGAKQLLFAVGLALVWTLFGGVKGFARIGDDGREGHELLVVHHSGEARRHAFIPTRGLS